MWEAINSRLFPIQGYLILFLSLILSVGGMILFHDQPTNAGRGGAIAVAVSFFVMFVNYGSRHRTIAILVDEASTMKTLLAKFEGKKASETDRIEALEARVNGLSKALVLSRNIDTTSSKSQNLMLAISSIVGTLAWGFADLIVGIRL